MDKQIKVTVIGGTGACGRELIKLLQQSNQIDSITLPTRRSLPQWTDNPSKLNIIQLESLDQLQSHPSIFTNIDVVFCCLGSRVNRGTAEFTKVDYDYVIQSANLAKQFNVTQFQIISSTSTNSKSMFQYLRVKGKCEDELIKMQLDSLIILKPGALLNRDNDKRCGETILKYIPGISKIQCVDVAKCMLHIATAYYNKTVQFKKVEALENKDILQYNKS